MTKETPLDDAAEKRNLFYAHADECKSEKIDVMMLQIVLRARGRMWNLWRFYTKRKLVPGARGRMGLETD